MAVTQGLPSAADVLLITDKLGSILKAQQANLGRNVPGESGTLAVLTAAARDGILGDGTLTGLSNQALKAVLANPLNLAASQAQYPWILGQMVRTLFTQLDAQIVNNLPTGWSFAVSGGARALDLWLKRLNANGAGTLAAPAAPTLTATTGGSLPNVVAGSAPRVKLTLFKAGSDWLESQPSPASAQVALSGANNAYTFTLAGNAPTGAAYLGVYRQLVGAAVGDPYYYDQRVAVTPGSPYPAVTLKQADAQLRLDLTPPAWLSALLMPEAAALFALAYATFATAPGSQQTLLTFPTQAFPSESNVSINPASGFLGINDPASGGEFARWVATVKTFGGILTANDAAQALQGFLGAAGGLQARVLAALDTNATLTNIAYSYYDAANWPTLQTGGNVAGPLTLNAALGQTVDLAITAGRLVTAVTAMTVAGAATGTFILEAKALRTL